MIRGKAGEPDSGLIPPASGQTPPQPPRHSHILVPGRNVWRLARATRAAVLIDADSYFRRLDQSLRMARRTIWIVGWDFNGQISLRPEDGGEPLGALLRSVVEQHEQLEIRILVWALGVIYSQKSLHLPLDPEWADHPRISVRLDAKHPIRASHHQKLVCIDDRVAFAGGMDLTIKRWDTSEHLAARPGRVEPDGSPYGPVHDVQMAVEGDAARALGDLARDRWRMATGEELRAVRSKADCWPGDLAPDFRDVRIGIARTRPAFLDRSSKREAARLNRDALSSARRFIYIETQYLASSAVCRVLCSRLAEEDGPEVVILVTRSSRGVFEQFVMGGNRDRLIRRLRRANRFGRLRVVYAVVPDGEGECEVLIHSKIVAVDDVFLRVGSSNLNNRSEGLDTECDLAVEARDEAQRLAIANLRNRLVAEHIGATPEIVRSVIAEESSLVRAIDRLNAKRRGLREFAVNPAGGTTLLFGTGLLDPKRPYWPLQLPFRRIGKWLKRVSRGFL